MHIYTSAAPRADLPCDRNMQGLKCTLRIGMLYVLSSRFWKGYLPIPATHLLPEDTGDIYITLLESTGHRQVYETIETPKEYQIPNRQGTESQLQEDTSAAATLLHG